MGLEFIPPVLDTQCKTCWEEGLTAAVVSLVCGPSCPDAGFPWFLPVFQPQSLWLALILGTPGILKITTPLLTEPEDNCYLEPQV